MKKAGHYTALAKYNKRTALKLEKKNNLAVIARVFFLERWPLISSGD
ncbi:MULTISPECIES: hypothetical protein [unclassified Oceanobacter]|nr:MULTISPECIES: hypothetical protein [unclassified Oceanobacter]MDO6681519.1 hypothetical protein [Oceanobacter sp. 5_MG-2023]MDP2548689.1 hypothetical protein [Oceanobacter sp. 4_MG-2023]